MGKLKHLDEELNVNQSPPSRLQVKPGFRLVGEFLFEPPAQPVDFLGKIRSELFGINKILYDFHYLLTERAVSRNGAGFYKSLPLPDIST